MGKRIIKYLKFLMECVLNIIYGNDEKCVICENYINYEMINNNGNICNSCLKKIFRVKGQHEFFKGDISIKYYSACYYSGIVVDLIRKLKYKSDFYAGAVIRLMMINTITEENIIFDLITFVPGDSRVIKKRGYNQSKYLADGIGKTTGIMCKELLTKVKSSKDQIGLDSFSRWNNLKNCFIAKKNISLKGKKILLVDDVITTGATAYYCVMELKKIGADEVILLTGAKSSL